MSGRHAAVMTAWACLALVHGFAPAQGTDAQMDTYDVVHYDLGITMDFLHKGFSGDVTMHCTAVSPFSRFVLNADDDMLKIDSVLYNGAPVTYIRADDHLSFDAPHVAKKGDAFTVEVRFRGHGTSNRLNNRGGMDIALVDGLGRAATTSEPVYARTWWPCKDVPKDKATLTTSITVPNNLLAVSNGLLIHSDQGDGVTTYVWNEEYPISTYLVSIDVARYRAIPSLYVGLHGEKMHVTCYAYPEDFEKARVDFSHVSDILHFLAEKFGEYPFIKEKFGCIEAQGGNMTMENQTICSIEQAYITGDERHQTTLVHEIAHQWFGDLLTPSSWNDIWLNEGFAAYAEALYDEHLHGAEGYRSEINDLMNPPGGDYDGAVVGREDTNYQQVFSHRVYNKGALILHMLRGVMGDGKFFDAMRDYTGDASLRYGSVTTADFERACEGRYGGSLKWFFDEWAYADTPVIDRPSYDCTWKVQPSNFSYAISLAIKQTTATSLTYRMPFQISIATSASTRVIDVVDSSVTQTFVFRTDAKPREYIIDPMNWVFKHMSVHDPSKR